MTKYFVVDGDQNADIYGEASSPEEARAIAESCFADAIGRIELYGPITLTNGETLPLAYVAITKEESPACPTVILSGGACNVSGIARSLVKAADAARADGVQPCEDLAVRAIVAQLAWLCKVDSIGGVCGVVDIESALKEKGGV